MEVILDTNFILTCIKEKIDFLDAEEFGELVLPLQVIEELEKLKEKGKSRESENANLAVQIISKNKMKFKIIKLENEFVDAGIKKYAENKRVIVATLDKKLKKDLKGNSKLLAIKSRKKLELV